MTLNEEIPVTKGYVDKNNSDWMEDAPDAKRRRPSWRWNLLFILVVLLLVSAIVQNVVWTLHG